MSLSELASIARELGAKTALPSITVQGTKGFKCYCPIHHDTKSPNLDIWVDRKGLLAAHCHACNDDTTIITYLRDKYLKEYPPLFHASAPKPTEETKTFKIVGNNVERPENTNFTLSSWKKNYAKYCQPTAVYTYNNPDGTLWGYVARYDRPGHKRFCQWTYQQNPRTKETVWKEGLGGYKDSKPLYRQDNLSNRTVLMVEGEKTADAAAEIFPEYDVVTYMSGAVNWRSADLHLLVGKHVKLWYDHDFQGTGYSEFCKLASTLEGMNCTTELVVLPQSKELPDHWDLADATEDDLGWIRNAGWTDNYQRLMWQMQITDVSYLIELPRRFMVLPGAAAANTFIKMPQRIGGQLSLPFMYPSLTITDMKRLIGKSKTCISELDNSKIHVVDGCIEHESFPHVFNYTFDPSTTEAFVKVNGRLLYNIYTGLPWPGQKDEKLVDQALDYITNLIGPETAWLINYIAHAVQLPDHKPSTALTMVGDQGVGKTILLEFIARLFGTSKDSPDGYAYICNDIGIILQPHFTGIFGKLFILADEAGALKNNAVILKVDGEITANITSVNPKNKPMASAPNYTRWIFATNERNTKLRDGDRRHVLIEVGTMNPDKERWSDISDFFKNPKVCEAFMYYLRHYEVNADLVHNPPKTEYKKQIEVSSNPYMALAKQLLEDGQIDMRLVTGQSYTITADQWKKGPIDIPCTAFAQWMESKLPNNLKGSAWPRKVLPYMTPKTTGDKDYRAQGRWQKYYDQALFEQTMNKEPRLNQETKVWRLADYNTCCAHFYNETGLLID